MTEDLVEKAIELYLARPDKEWGLTDCASLPCGEDRQNNAVSLDVQAT